MPELLPPDDVLVSRILSQVSFEDRLVGYRVRQRAGALPVSLYSVEEVVHLLNDKFPRLSLQRLEEWLRTVIKDEQLADGIAEAAQEDASDRDRMLRVRTLMGERLCQCKSAGQPSTPSSIT